MLLAPINIIFSDLFHSVNLSNLTCIICGFYWYC